MSERRRVLVIVAHPDDAEISMGMRIRWLVLQGADVRIHCLSTGEGRPHSETGNRPASSSRTEESAAAGRVLGVTRYTFSQIPDSRFTAARSDINAQLFEVIRSDRPDDVYTHYPRDQHLDHVVAGEEVSAVAFREASDIYYFRSPYSVSFVPNLFFLGTPELAAAKMAALRCFKSQSQLNMDVFLRLAAVTHHQYIHHRVLERINRDTQSLTCETFQVSRLIEDAAAERS